MTPMLTSRLAARPRRSLLIVLLFVALAAVLGGPVVGQLEGAGGFVAPGADSELADDRVERATGVQGGAAVAVLVEDGAAARAEGVADDLAEVPGVVRTDVTTLPDGRRLVTATLRSGADDEAVAEAALDRFGDEPGLTVGGAAVADLQIGETVSADLGRVGREARAGSVVLPLKAVAMNALTVGAALAPLTLIYQEGRLTDVFGYTSNGGVEPTSFLVTAATVFALSTDYGVFLLDRIQEARGEGVAEREAVATGLARTGRVVTAAALLLAVAIGAFSTSSISFIQQIGVATAFGVLIDAFVVRALLVPSLMALLGRRNWWSPPALRRLHGGLRGAGVAHGRSPRLAVR